LIAIIGSKGQLGWELVRQGRAQAASLLALDVGDIDITDLGSIENNLQNRDIEAVINAAAYTAVDRAESEPRATFAVNLEGARNLARFCRRSGVPFIHTSTDYVFDGTQQRAYRESDPVSPLGVYARSKAEGEAAVRDALEAHVIVRTAWLNGVHGNNFVKTMLRLGKEREEIRVVDDQRGCPTFAEDLAAALWTICDRLQEGLQTAWGTYHFCNAGETSWHGLAEAIFAVARKYEDFQVQRIVPITTEEYPTAAARPKHSVLDCTRIEQYFGVRRRPWKDALENMLQRLYNEQIEPTEHREGRGR
jgi:dTDP-4-dehydrorhamnose reductase